MSEAHPGAIEFLARRQSIPAKLIGLPVPGDDELSAMLQSAMRVPDHGKLEPWRILVLKRAALDRLATATHARLLAKGSDEEVAAKAAQLFSGSPLVVAVVQSVVESPKIPVSEQVYSAGNVCFGVVNNALARGWAATWQSGPVSTDSTFLVRELGLAEGETIAGFIVIGSCPSVPQDRPRPDLSRKVVWISE